MKLTSSVVQLIDEVLEMIRWWNSHTRALRLAEGGGGTDQGCSRPHRTSHDSLDITLSELCKTV